ncbi:hypothetical protein [Hymenobacter sp. BT491]|uniref:hypothetical protein n=1 Tax=Hymenobacter sp. BT491 TaxID=2766779 RepID=UPI001653C0D5|nr:hypothetical protein [Hymenobacter sp. BT491]MBC6992250.1 hypothetical protein [Hymenobacter sp. BT491]
MARGWAGQWLAFEEVCQLRPGDRILEIDDAPWGGRVALVVVTVPQVSGDGTADGRQVTFIACPEVEGQEIEYLLSENYYPHAARLYRPAPEAEATAQPTEPQPTVAPRPGLGELDIPDALDALFPLGELLAKLNAAGALFLPGFTGDIVLNARTGEWVICTPDHVELDAFAPAKAAGQFAGLTGEPFRALLAGYARRAYQVLEPAYPGFTHSLLAHLLPVPVPVAPKPRPQFLDLSRVLQAYGVALRLDASARRLAFAAPAVPAAPPTDAELLQATLVVFAAQLNLTAWLTQVAACEPARPVAQILGALARGELFDPEWGGVIPKLLGSYRPQQQLRARLASQPPALAPPLGLLAEVYARAGHLEAIYAQHAAFRFLRAMLDRLPPGPVDPPAERGAWVAALMDGLDELARLADAQGQVVRSLQFAQEAQIALQLLPCPAEPAEAEAWLARVYVQEQRFGWSRLGPETVLDEWTVWNYAHYAGSARLAAEAFCEAAGAWYAQGRVTNQLWTGAWRALKRLRLALRLCYALSQQQPLPEKSVRRSLEQALPRWLSHYQQAIRTLIAMFIRNGEARVGLSMWAECVLDPEGTALEDPLFQRELEGSNAVYDALMAHGYGPEALQCLGELVAVLTGAPAATRAPGHPGEAPTPADEGKVPSPAYCAEEDRVYQQVLGPLLRQEYLASAGHAQYEDGRPVIPPPDGPFAQAADKWAYYEAYLAEQPDAYAPPGVLNLAPTLRSLPDCAAEYGFMLTEPTLPERTRFLQELTQTPDFAALVTRAFASVHDTWRYTSYWRYEPFRQYPDPPSSWGLQLGLQLSRVGFNTARDTGFFFYELDHHTHILCHVAVVRKQQGCWVLEAH